MKKLIILGVISLIIIPSCVQMYQAFHAPRCPQDRQANDPPCWTSLFTEGEPMDIFAYVTTNPKLKWWTMAGFQELVETPVWNRTSIPYGSTVLNTTVRIPFSMEALHSVRRNESTLYVHCYLMRGGIPVVDALQHMDESTPSHRRIFTHLVHAKARITRRLPLLRQARRSLLSNTTESSKDAEVSSSISIPGISFQVPIYPRDALMWAGAFFASTAFLPPSFILATMRQIVAVVLVPWLWNEKTKVDDRSAAQRQQEQQLDQQWWQLQGPTKVGPHLVPKLRIALSTDSESYDGRYYPPLLYKEMEVKEGQMIEKDVRYSGMTIQMGDGKEKRVLVPPMHIETWGMQQRSWRALDSNVSRGDIDIEFEFDVTGMWRYTVMQTVKQSLDMYMQFGFTERDLDEIRDFMFRHPLHIMAIMQLIGFIQMFLTTMAFKNDISFFKGRKDYTGLSSRSLATDTLQEIIIFLYLFDYEEISRIVLFQVGAGAVVGAWKYIRVSRLKLAWQYLLPWLRPTRGTEGNQAEQDTEEIDAKGMRYLAYILYPLSVCWGLYNLYHYAYKSWWSWLVSSLADFAYTFGFINMMPQIFINYKLKSVAHMPWRVLAYKFFNTFIDDVFAFFIMADYMTKKHRYMTLRDDIIFFVFMYQRYVYSVDMTRADEFGFVYQEGDATASGAELQDDPEVLTLRTLASDSSDEIRLQAWNIGGTLLLEKKFPSSAQLKDIEALLRQELRPKWLQVGLWSGEKSVARDEKVCDHPALTARGRQAAASGAKNEAAGAQAADQKQDEASGAATAGEDKKSK